MLALLTASSGCTSFQCCATPKWLDTVWYDEGRGVSEVMVRWDHRIRVTEDSVSGGVPLPGIAGRVYLFNSNQSVDAHGKVAVQMVDMTDVRPGVPPRKIASWEFDPESLKRLKREDVAGYGYTLFLPWAEYDPAVRRVQLQVTYYPKNGSPYFASPQLVSLQSESGPAPIITGSGTSTMNPASFNR
jgi:hypothetical protein